MSAKGVYKNFRICQTCNKNLPLNREHFRTIKSHKKEVFQLTCRKCQLLIENIPIWKDNNLLCNNCKNYLPETEFTSNGSKNKDRNFKKYCCKKCSTKRQNSYIKNLDDNTKLHKTLNYRLLGAKERSIKSKINFNIDLEYIKNLWEIQQQKCKISNIEMTFEMRKGRTFTNVSIDRIDSKKGYVKGNIQLVCMAINQMKSDLTKEELIFFCKKIIENENNN